MKSNNFNFSEYLTINDVSLMTGLAKPTIRAMYNNKTHSYRDNFPKPIKVSFGRVRILFNKSDILEFIKSNQAMFNKPANFKIELSSPTVEHNYYSINVCHNPTETSVTSKIHKYEFDSINKDGLESDNSKILIARIMNKIIRSLSSFQY